MDHSKQASEVFDKLAALYQSKYMDVSAYATQLDDFLELLKVPHPHILEIACGPGNITRYLLNKRPDLQIFGTDLAPAMIELAKINCPEASFAVMDCRNISSLQAKYDAIIASFCLPYLNRSEVKSLLKDISDLLHPGGKLYLSTIEAAHEKSGYKKGSTGDMVFMHYYELADIESLLWESDLHVLSQSRVGVTGNDNADIDLIIITVKQTDL